MTSLSEIREIYRRDEQRLLEELCVFLGFPSISTDPAFDADCRRCVSWLRDHVATMGFRAELIETPGKPLLFAELPGVPGLPTILFYGHYDVQPVDPLDLWKTPPFEPVISEGKIRARGAQDNKGQLFYVLKAIEALKATGSLKCGLKLLIEGEEEAGSEGIQAVLESIRPRIAADVLMVCDTGTLDPALATITMGLRGILHFELNLSGPAHDLHSGVYGGIMANPATQLARIVASLHDENGRIAVPGFYEGIDPVSAEDRKLAESCPISLETVSAQVGVPFHGGERSLPALERRSFQPAIDVNGFHSGYGGAGGKTIIPAHAMAKISVRLAAGQDPERVLEMLVAYLEKQPTHGLSLTIDHRAIGGPGMRLSSKSPVLGRAHKVLEQLMDKPPIYMWEGASIPVVAKLVVATGAEPLLVGFGLEEDCIHAPNETFRVEQFQKGFCYAATMLDAFGHKG